MSLIYPAPPTVALALPGYPVDLQLAVHGSGDTVISPRLRADGIWEPFETALILAALRPGDCFVDVGANLGYFSVLAASRVGPRGQVFAYEPEPANFSLLQHNLALNKVGGWSRSYRLALSDTAGETPLYYSDDNYGDHRVFASGQYRRGEPITLVPGSAHLESRVSDMDFIKIDTQGAELAVLRGLLPLLLRLASLPRLLIELTPFDLRRAGGSGRELIELVQGLGQPLWIVDHLQHRLVACSAAELALWCDNVDACDGDRGFMNILCGEWIDTSAHSPVAAG